METPAPWADIETDGLVHVFARLDLDDLAASAPLVCRGWRRAAADPSLWRALDLRRDHLARFMPWAPLAAAFERRYAVHRFSLAGFLRLCVSRARGSTEDVALPPLLSDPADEIHHISLLCPKLRRLALPQLTSGDEARLPDLVQRWPLLEHLELDTKPSSFPALAAQLALHCPAFASLVTGNAGRGSDPRPGNFVPNRGTGTRGDGGWDAGGTRLGGKRNGCRCRCRRPPATASASARRLTGGSSPPMPVAEGSVGHGAAADAADPKSFLPPWIGG